MAQKISQEPPAHLEGDAADCYKKIVDDLPNLRPIHEGEVEMAAEAYGRFCTLSKEKNRREKESIQDTYVTETTSGNPAYSILIKQMDEAIDTYRDMLTQLKEEALTPDIHPSLFHQNDE